MRSIEGNNMNGSEAILIVLVDWWKVRVLDEWVHEYLQTCSPTHFLYAIPHYIGDIILKENSNLLSDFWVFLDRVPATAHMKGILFNTCNRKELNDHLEKIASYEIGWTVKKTGWFEEHDREIVKTRKALKVVEKVMES